MPPPNRALYDVLCVALGAAEIIGRAGSIQAEHFIGQRAIKRDWYGNEVGTRQQSHPNPSATATTSTAEIPSDQTSPKMTPQAPVLESGVSLEVPESSNKSLPSSPPLPFTILDQQRKRQAALPVKKPPVHLIPPSLDVPISTARATPTPVGDKEADLPPPLSSVPVSPIVDNPYTPTATRVLPPLPELALEDDERVTLAAGLTTGAATEYIRRQATSSRSTSSEPAPPLMMSEANVTRLVNSLSQMRGAALKLGQFMSIQDAHVLPDQIERVLRKVQNAAHYMPEWQMEQVMKTELGLEWRSLFETFETVPIASASIGQVHVATLSPSSSFHPNHAHPSSQSPPPPTRLAVKVQFPNVQKSITSDIRTITALLSRTTPLLPKGLFLGKTLDVFKGELADECDYLREASAAVRFGKLLEGDERFRVPKVFGLTEGADGKDRLTTGKVLAMEWMEGSPVGAAVKWEQEVRDEIARSVLVLCFKELFHFRFMQTDPNWSNFLYNRQTRQIELIDFGASREYSKEFMDKWFLLFKAAVDGDRQAALEQSLALGYLLPGENQAMLDAHLETMSLLGEPFRSASRLNGNDGRFDFSSNILPTQIRALIPTMLQNRLTPPPRETYSLNRKLSGAFLLCGRLKARVDCASIWEEVVGSYRLS
ncbi:hypothetical protein FRB97_009256 [Tulasnella sp. 331]|nr:hypothetical protein FRB97_009256 [Tulasnella sp. 331]